MNNYSKLLVATLSLLLGGCGIDRGGIDTDPEPLVADFPGAAIVGELKAVNLSDGEVLIGEIVLTVSDTTIDINGEAADAADLVPGMIGVATLLADGNPGLSSKLSVDYNVAGAPIQDSDFPNSVTMLGQTILTSSLMPAAPFADLIVPNVSALAFSGFEATTGEVYATTVIDYPVNAPSIITGTARLVDVVSFVFSIGQQQIDYSQVQSISTSTGSIAENMRLRVQVDPGPAGSSLNSISITEVPLLDSTLLAGASVNITGYAFLPASNTLTVANLDLLIDDNTEFQNVEVTSLTGSSLVTVEGVLQIDGLVRAITVASTD